MKLAFWRKNDMSNFAQIAKKMDDLQTKIVQEDGLTKQFADKAVAAHQRRTELEQELLNTREELSGALGAIVDFLGGLTVLPPLVLEADQVVDQEAAAAEAELAAAEAVTAETNPGADTVVVADTPAAPAAPAVTGGGADLGLPGADTLDTPAVDDTPAEAPAATTPVVEANPAPEQPVGFDEPVAGDLGIVGGSVGLGLPGEDTVGTPAPAAEPAVPSETPASTTPVGPSAEDIETDPTLAPTAPTPAPNQPAAPVATPADPFAEEGPEAEGPTEEPAEAPAAIDPLNLPPAQV